MLSAGLAAVGAKQLAAAGGADARRPQQRPFEAAGRSLLTPVQRPGSGVARVWPGAPSCARPGSAQEDDEGISEAVWSRQVRASMKHLSRAAGESSASPRPSPPMTSRRHSQGSAFGPSRPPTGAMPPPAPVSAVREVEPDNWSSRPDTKAAGKARTSAFFEDLISFLELHRLSGAYALALSAHGIEDLSQLLQLDEDTLEGIISRCDIDAMDEILLKEALRSARMPRSSPMLS